MVTELHQKMYHSFVYLMMVGTPKTMTCWVVQFISSFHGVLLLVPPTLVGELSQRGVGGCGLVAYDLHLVNYLNDIFRWKPLFNGAFQI